MVRAKTLWLFAACGLMFGNLPISKVYAAQNEPINQKISADACDDRQADDDKKTAENRAADKAGLAAIKLSGVIQKYYPDLSVNALDLIAYRMIDEYVTGATHTVTLENKTRVCVKLNAVMELTTDDLAALVEEYKDSEVPEAEVAAVAAEVNEKMAFKPRSLNDKKLLYIRDMVFWNGEETNHYKDLLTGLFSHSQYFYVTEDANLADFVATPRLQKAEVDEIDTKNHKMQMQVELDVTSGTLEDFSPLKEQQNHFILFAADKDEQEIADNLLRKLLTRASNDISAKIDNFEAKRIENAELHGK